MHREVKLRVEERFGFGANWKRFLRHIDNDRIQSSEHGLRTLLGVSDLTGRTFLDIGCGSGLSSLAARNLGARVHAFDFDADSVEAAIALRSAFRPDDPDWTIERGDVLDADYVARLGTFDIVYSWGVLHHTGAMWPAIESAASRVVPGGVLALAIYNDQGRRSVKARRMKRRYVKGGALTRTWLVAAYMARSAMRAIAVSVRDRRLPRGDYAEQSRGMSWRTDALDWVGGYPFEVAKPEDLLSKLRPLGFSLDWLKTVGGGSGNNEYRFVRSSVPASATDPTEPPGAAGGGEAP
jgi:2-polyprenyl-6-hydroxyphenyl methylase/3-demethylubiquinone-9 3-methyltransferase